MIVQVVVVVGKVVIDDHCNAFKFSLMGARQCLHPQVDCFSNVSLPNPLGWCLCESLWTIDVDGVEVDVITDDLCDPSYPNW